MEKGKIETSQRHTVRSIRAAMQGNAIRALVELITNSDDSYIRLEDDDKPCKGKIEIEYNKEGYCGNFAVRDFAEGMSIDDVNKNFKTYGSATSGMKAGKRVRGYFGQGAKDALAGMIDGKICTFKNDKFVECKLFIEEGESWYEISDQIEATQELRTTHKISENGTIAYFKADPHQLICSVPQFNTVQEELANNYLLRKIMMNPKRRIVLLDLDSRKERPLFYKKPPGKEILADEFIISYGDYGDFPINISIWRAIKDLSQTGDDRDGSLLIVDEEDAVLDISLFRYETEPLAWKFFGEVKINRFRDLLEKEEPVLRQERDGIENKHPFCQKLINEIEKRIEEKIKEERSRKQKEIASKIDREEVSRYKKAFRILNKIAETEAQDVTNLGGDPTDTEEEPPKGFCIYPQSAQITVAKRYALQLRFSTKVIPYGSNIKIACNSSKFHLSTTDIKVTTEDGSGIITKYITVEGREPNIIGTITATTGIHLTESNVHVIPEKEFLFSEGMVFQPESLTLRPNQPRRVHLLVYVKMIEGGCRIKISSDNESIQISKNKVVVNENEAERHIFKQELEIWGTGADQDAVITAEYESFMALLEVKVRSKKDAEEKGRKGMFNEPDYDFEPEPLMRTSFSGETGKVIIYVNFPSIKHYIGDECQYRKTIPGQVLIADLVAERCFYEIARKSVESSGALLNPQSRIDKIQNKAYDLSMRFGKRIHEALVDQSLIIEHKKNFGEQ
ncbi:hypothetical protein CEE37_13735 [candidate division LCP-89 bacterium B3_LCP]|uniref:Uncharacterized protein n=1 Tax=candidate division LCP-89 bacterium B3_LCP TaxID=2012998 RepID=A0A532URL7_UNCL8|nr:MAG: hypothetical protein CEE37_13735 [candidate division LCP-89 bacterium B3_LCP]